MRMRSIPALRSSDGKPLEPICLVLKAEKPAMNTINCLSSKGDHCCPRFLEGRVFTRVESKYKIERTLFGENEEYKILGCRPTTKTIKSALAKNSRKN